MIFKHKNHNLKSLLMIKSLANSFYVEDIFYWGIDDIMNITIM